MHYVTKYNWLSLYQKMKEEILSADFIGLSCDFSNFPNASLWDYSCSSSEELYNLLRKEVSDSVILKIALTLFTHDKHRNVICNETYIVPLLSFGYEVVPVKFNTYSLGHLIRNNFNFDQVFSKGVPFYRNKMKDKIKLLISPSFEDSLLIEDACMKVHDWQYIAVKGNILRLNQFPHHATQQLLNYFLHHEIRTRFTNVWTYEELNGWIRVVKIYESDHKYFTEYEKEFSELKENLLKSTLGFSALFKILCKFKKPLIGENMLVTLMHLYNQFEESLPFNFLQFKRRINKCFSNVYDLECVTREYKRCFPAEKFEVKNAQELYTHFKNSKFTFYPKIYDYYDAAYQDKNESSKQSYCIGWCFYFMNYRLNNNDRSAQCKSLCSTTSVEHVKNKVLLGGNLNFYVVKKLQAPVGNETLALRPDNVVSIEKEHNEGLFGSSKTLKELLLKKLSILFLKSFIIPHMYVLFLSVIDLFCK